MRGSQLACTAFRGKALFAEDRLATLLDGAGLERDLALVATLGAGGVVHLTIAEALGLARGAAVLAALGSAEVLGGVELLFAVRERECLSAIAARKLLISHKNERRKIIADCLLSCFSVTDVESDRSTSLKELLARSVQENEGTSTRKSFLNKT